MLKLDPLCFARGKLCSHHGKRVMESFKQLSIELAHDSARPVLRKYPRLRDISNRIRCSYTQMGRSLTSGCDHGWFFLMTIKARPAPDLNQGYRCLLFPHLHIMSFCICLCQVPYFLERHYQIRAHPNALLYSLFFLFL